MPISTDLSNPLTLEPGNIRMDGLSAMAERSSSLLSQVRQVFLPPDGPKHAPKFSISQIQPFFDVSLSSMYRRLEQIGVKDKKGKQNSSRYDLTLPQVRLIFQHFLPQRLRPDGQKAIVLTVGNFKGGSTKTSTSATLAQGLAMRGHNVLVVDTDPQGSLTTLFGVLPEAEVQRHQTILPVCTGEATSLMPSRVNTYWDGCFLIPAAPMIFEAEMALALQRQNIEFWRILDRALEEARELFDVIIIDTPPTLSYVTINTYWAADALIVPLPPNALDFASSSQFWSLFRDVCGNPMNAAEEAKKFEFLSIIPSRVDSADSSTELVLDWMKQAYGNAVSPVSIPKTAVTSSSAVSMGTIYDIEKYSGGRKTYLRAKEPYDQLVEHIEDQIIETWARRKGATEARKNQELNKGKKA